MPSYNPPVQMFLNMRLPIVRFRRPLFPDPRAMPQRWRTHRSELSAWKNTAAHPPAIPSAGPDDPSRTKQ